MQYFFYDFDIAFNLWQAVFHVKLETMPLKSNFWSQIIAICLE